MTDAVTLTVTAHFTDPDVGDVVLEKPLEISGPDRDGDIEILDIDRATSLYLDAGSVDRLIAELQRRRALLPGAPA